MGAVSSRSSRRRLDPVILLAYPHLPWWPSAKDTTARLDSHSRPFTASQVAARIVAQSWCHDRDDRGVVAS